jgi:uroporphyrinogen-III synthase
MNKKLNVILLKASDVQNKFDSDVKDRYIEYLSSTADIVINKIAQINLLSFKFINIDELKSKLKVLFYLNASIYGSLILTSKQTVEAIDNALSQLTLNTDFRQLSNNNQNLNKLKVYCVGNATESRFNKLISNELYNLNSNQFEVKLNNKTTNEHTQNARYLSQLIIQDANKLKIFYPCSSIRKSDLTDELNKFNLDLDELKVYETTDSENGRNQFINLVNTYQSDNCDDCITCLVFFSPSGVDALFNDNLCLVQNVLSNPDLRIISIGPSTSKRLQQLLTNIFIHELKTPSPQSLLETLKSIY